MRLAGVLFLALFVQDNKQAPKVIDKPEDIGKEFKGFEAVRKDAKLLVLACTAADCPISKLYLPKILRMAKQYTNVSWAMIGCNGTSKLDGVDLLFVKAGALAPKRTTDVFVLDANNVLRYRGAIDDQYGIGYERDKAEKNYLVDAIEALLAGKPVSVAATEAPGCAVEGESKPAANASVSYHKDVAPILQRACQECHRPGEIGPFSLLRYEQARAAAKRMKEVVTQRRMPPWHANPEHGKWENDRRLSDKEISTITSWIDAGCPEGNKTEAPAEKKWSDGWAIGTPDLVVKCPSATDVPAEGTIPYKYVRVKVPITEDKWVQAAEVRPGERSVVHHILVFVEYPRERRKDQPPIDGGLFNGYFAVMVPGERPVLYHEGMGKLLPAGSHLIFQIHYTANGKAAKDQSQAGFVFSKVPVKNEVVTRGIVDRKIKIPPGADNHREEAQFTFHGDAKILSFLPHLHLRGKSFRYTAIHPDGKEEVLLDVPAYDFRWQNIYRYPEPKFVKDGTKIKAVAHYDNSKNNPANPDPNATVTWGEQSWDEMLIGYVDFIRVKE
jgi:hypothetical protein